MCQSDVTCLIKVLCRASLAERPRDTVLSSLLDCRARRHGRSRQGSGREADRANGRNGLDRRHAAASTSAEGVDASAGAPTRRRRSLSGSAAVVAAPRQAGLEQQPGTEPGDIVAPINARGVNFHRQLDNFIAKAFSSYPFTNRTVCREACLVYIAFLM